MSALPPLLQVCDLSVTFRRHHTITHAVSCVNLSVCRGETLGIVGESGSGKSTLARALMQLIKPAAGHIYLDGNDIVALWNKRFGVWYWGGRHQPIRRRLQMIFQDPYASLNPRMSVYDSIAQPLRMHRLVATSDEAAHINTLLEQVGINPQHAAQYPRYFSGGQKQRIAIARALATKPDIIIADEATSALDVSIQAQILNLLRHLQNNLQLTYIFISHNLAAVRYMADRIAVMYRGRIVEIAPQQAICTQPMHPYTQTLVGLSTAYTMNDTYSLSHGCAFEPYCKARMQICKEQIPQLIQINATHRAACHLYK